MPQIHHGSDGLYRTAPTPARERSRCAQHPPKHCGCREALPPPCQGLSNRSVWRAQASNCQNAGTGNIWWIAKNQRMLKYSVSELWISLEQGGALSGESRFPRMPTHWTHRMGRSPEYRSDQFGIDFTRTTEGRLLPMVMKTFSLLSRNHLLTDAVKSAS